jgi:predicted dinucleotide-binding enzyme
MSPTHGFSIGVIAAGSIAQADAARAVKAGHQIKLSNSRGSESLAELVDRFVVKHPLQHEDIHNQFLGLDELHRHGR